MTWNFSLTPSPSPRTYLPCPKIPNQRFSFKSTAVAGVVATWPLIIHNIHNTLNTQYWVGGHKQNENATRCIWDTTHTSVECIFLYSVERLSPPWINVCYGCWLSMTVVAKLSGLVSSLCLNLASSDRRQLGIILHSVEKKKKKEVTSRLLPFFFSNAIWALHELASRLAV